MVFLRLPLNIFRHGVILQGVDMMRSWKQVVCWVIGLFVLLWVSEEIREWVRGYMARTYEYGSVMWIHLLLDVCFGMYLGVALVPRMKRGVRWPVLGLVFAPCVVLLGWTLCSFAGWVRMTPMMAHFLDNAYIQITCGAALVAGLFGGKE